MIKEKKKVGNALRTRGQIRSSKSRGASFEYDTLHNLQRTFPDMYLTSKQGFQQQYDLRDDKAKMVVECKNHKSISWSQAKKWFEKLRGVTPKGYRCYLVFHSNRQPVLVMWNTYYITGELFVSEFEPQWGVFEKHPSTRSKKKVVKE